MRALMKWILAQNKHWENFSVTQKLFLGDRRTCDLLVPSLDPRERHKPSLVTILGLREDHQTWSWPKLQLRQNFQRRRKPSWDGRRTGDLLVPSLDPREWHRPSLVMILGLREHHQTGSWNKLQLGPNFQ